VIRPILIVLLVVVALVATLVYSQRRAVAFKVSGFIEADEVRVGSRVGGRVARTIAQEGQQVRAGDLLVELDPYDLTARLVQARAQRDAKAADHAKLVAGFRSEEIAQAQAKLDQLRANLQKLRSGPRRQEIGAAEARVTLAQAQQRLAQSTLKRMSDAFERNAASQDEFNRATDELASAESTLMVRQQELDQLKEGTRQEDLAAAEAQVNEATASLELMKKGYRAEEIAQAKAALDAAEADVVATERQLSELSVRAPGDGIVQAIDLQPGDMVPPNAPMLSMLDTSRLWVRAYVPENRLNIRVGDRASVGVDSFPGKRFAGHVVFVASQAEFTPRNVQTPEERSKQVFRIKVELDEGQDQLRPGMAADVWQDSETQSAER
jgi:multidrug resistance efflux pump